MRDANTNVPKWDILQRCGYNKLTAHLHYLRSRNFLVKLHFFDTCNGYFDLLPKSDCNLSARNVL